VCSVFRSSKRSGWWLGYSTSRVTGSAGARLTISSWQDHSLFFRLARQLQAGGGAGEVTHRLLMFQPKFFGSAFSKRSVLFGVLHLGFTRPGGRQVRDGRHMLSLLP
jgi:hypothetical protein